MAFLKKNFPDPTRPDLTILHEPTWIKFFLTQTHLYKEQQIRFTLRLMANKRGDEHNAEMDQMQISVMIVADIFVALRVLPDETITLYLQKSIFAIKT